MRKWLLATLFLFLVPTANQPTFTPPKPDPEPHLDRVVYTAEELLRAKQAQDVGAPPTGTQRASSSTAYLCVGDAQNHIELFYVKPTDVANRYSEAITPIQEFFFWAANRINARTAELAPGKTAKIPVLCGADGRPRVAYWAGAQPKATMTLGQWRNEMKATGLYDRGNEKYWAWIDGAPTGVAAGSGIAGMAGDDTNSTLNRSNTTSYAVTYGDPGSGGTMLHEGGHTMGAVSYTTPNTSGKGHCFDERDAMCYDEDLSDGNQTFVACSSAAVDGISDHWDCNADDYFHPNPPSGSYLATHWNLASCNNLFLRITGCTYPAPTPPPNPVQNFSGGRNLATLGHDLSWQAPPQPPGWFSGYRLYGCNTGEMGLDCEPTTLLYQGGSRSWSDTTGSLNMWCYAVLPYNSLGNGPRTKLCLL